VPAEKIMFEGAWHRRDIVPSALRRVLNCTQ